MNATAAAQSPRMLRHVDGIRGLAIAAVVGFHAFPAAVPGGFSGVDMFLVVSGYLIGSQLFEQIEAGRARWAAFWTRRVIRLFPALILTLLAVLWIGWRWLPASAFEPLGRQALLGALFVANIGFWQQTGYFDGASRLEPLLHLWTLSLEEQYYLVAPALMALAHRFHRFRAMLWALALASLALSVWGTSKWPQASYFLLPARAWELLAGALLALHARRLQPLVDTLPRAAAEAASLLALGALVACSFALDRHSTYPGWLALIPVGGAAWLVVGGASSRIATLALASAPLVWLGRISYALYLLHWPALVFLRWVDGPDPAPLRILTVLAGCLLVAHGLWRAVETPLRAVGRAGGPRATRLALALVAAALLCAALGAAVSQSRGAPDRDRPRLHGLAGFRFDFRAAYGSGRCFIDEIGDLDKARNFSPSCIDAAPPGAAAAPLWVVWGDSMAAQLVPGLRAQPAGSPRLAQFTIAACPPAIGYQPLPLCGEVNQGTLQRITSLAPQAVVLSGLDWGLRDLDAARATVAALRRDTRATLVLVGIPPLWREPLPRVAWRAARRGDAAAGALATGAGSDATAAEVDPRSWERDQELRELASRLGLRYVSIVERLCPGRRCRTHAGDSLAGLLAWDAIHLTPAGSAIVAADIAAAIAAPAPQAMR